MSQTRQSTSTNSSGSPSASSTGQSQENRSKVLLYAITVAVIIIIVVGLFILGQSFRSPSMTSVGSTNGTPVYLSYYEGETLFGPISNYSTFDLFNSGALLNISVIEGISPYAAGNVLEGWGTLIEGQNVTYNATMEFYIMKANNASDLSRNISSSLSQFFSTSPQTEQGTYNGLTYIYNLYINSTTSSQIVTGWKGNYTVMSLIVANPSFAVNPNSIIKITANDTP